ncbi:hypothetical protein [Microbacterium sp. VKM Ac-2923]|uniref:hypothetical protein n=1 Tax=Microbacterium sp. VKM Ac-2923 TaxID=2929476 RepID=UPI001FB38862|nr:hypothetical protein [Microbacterium sp. VKM Ac-2923]MCJ1708722.1 hypothetical protein [Microbacterium sp. VKM Ac-2923]
MSANEKVALPAVDPFEAEFAEEYVHLSRDLIAGDPCSIYVEQFDDPHLSRGNARAVGLRLLALADEWDRIDATGGARHAPSVPIQAYAADRYDDARRSHLRRLPDVDDELRERDV